MADNERPDQPAQLAQLTLMMESMQQQYAAKLEEQQQAFEKKIQALLTDQAKSAEDTAREVAAATAEAALGARKAEIEDLKLDRASITSNLEDTNKAYAEKQAYAQRLNKTIQELQTKKGALDKELTSATTSQQRIAQLAAQKAEVVAELATAQGQKATALQELTKANDRIRALEGQLNSAELKIKALTDENTGVAGASEQAGGNLPAAWHAHGPRDPPGRVLFPDCRAPPWPPLGAGRPGSPPRPRAAFSSRPFQGPAASRWPTISLLTLLLCSMHPQSSATSSAPPAS